MLKNPSYGGVNMIRSSNCRYSKEFRCEAMKMVVEGGESSQLSLPKSTLENWVRAFKAGKLSNIGG
jgi:transposase